MGILSNLKLLLGRKDPAVSSPPVTGSQRRKYRILIVEDEPALANALELELTESNYDVKKAANGREGLTIAKLFQPDLIILDILMPIMDGKSMLLKLREDPSLKILPVIILTNAGDIENLRQTVVYSDADLFLVKSNVTPQDIALHVKNLL